MAAAATMQVAAPTTCWYCDREKIGGQIAVCEIHDEQERDEWLPACVDCSTPQPWDANIETRPLPKPKTASVVAFYQVGLRVVGVAHDDGYLWRQAKLTSKGIEFESLEGGAVLNQRFDTMEDAVIDAASWYETEAISPIDFTTAVRRLGTVL